MIKNKAIELSFIFAGQIDNYGQNTRSICS